MTGPTRADVTVRLDTRLRARATELEINLSRLLEDGLRYEVERRQTIAKMLKDAGEIRLNLEDESGRPYIGRLRGRFLGEARGVEVYLADDERVIAYDGQRSSYTEVQDLSDLEGWFPHDPDVYADVMYALGETPVVNL
jgi:Post-segregation antitoxin CcdA